MKNRFHYFNPYRLYQAVYLGPYLLAQGLGATEHRVLEVLARKMARKTKPGTLTEVDTCFPSLETLATESLLSERAVRYALDALLETGFITKSKIAGRKLHKGKNRNKFENNRYHVVPELWDTVESPFGGQAAPAPAQPPAPPKASAPTNLPEISAADAEVIDNLDDVAADAEIPAPSSEEEKKTVGKIHKLLKTHFGDHPTYKHPDADRMMSRCIDDYIAEAGDAATCLNVLTWAFDDEKKKTTVERSAKSLGGYIRKCLTGWCAEWRDQGDTFEDDVPAEVQEFIDYLCISGPGTWTGGGDTYINEFRARLKDELGPHLLDLDQEDNSDGSVVLTPTISRLYKIAYILRKHTGQEVTPDEVPSFIVGETVAQARWAVAHEPWASRLIESDEPMKYFIGYCRDIGKEMKRSDDATPSEKPKEEPSYLGPINPPVATQDDDWDEL